MAEWIQIAVDDMNDVCVGAQMTALRSAALAEGQVDPFAKLMADRCAYIRNRIAGRVQLSATVASIPPELKTTALMLILEVMQTRIPALRLKEDQVRLIERAYKDLEIAGTNDLPISSPTDAETPAVQSKNGAIRIVKKTTPNLSRSSMSGL